MAGTVETTEITYPAVKKVKIAWTCDASGDADGVTTAVLTGKLVQVTTVPDATDAPTTGYSVKIEDADGVDLLAGAGANRHTANTEHLTSANIGSVSVSTLKLVVAAAGVTKKGVVYVYIK